MGFERVQPQDVDAAWPEVEAMVSAACGTSGGRYTADHAKQFAKDGAWQIWIVRGQDEKVAFVGATEIVVYPTGLRSLAWRFGTGEGREWWLHMMNDVCSLARDQCGCTRSEGAFRKGWRRVLSNWSHTHEFLERDL